jgi:hypothetical protein
VRAHFAEDVRRGDAILWRPAVEPGEEAQVNYGYMAPGETPAPERPAGVGLSHGAELLPAPLRLSDPAHGPGLLVRRPLAAFEFFGGVPAGRIVLDNLKTGVVRPDLYDPKLNRAYAELVSTTY